jgi:hypothetical protein
MQVFEVFGDLIFRDGDTENRLRRISSVVDSAQEKMVNIGNAMSNVGQGLMDLGSRMTQSFTVPIINAVKDSINLASDLGEAYNVVDVTFGKNSDRVKDWSKSLMDSFGLVQLESINYVGSMGAMLKSSGFTAEASEEMAKKIVELTGDMSSFYNLSHEETWEKLRSGIAGETEPLKALGINMSVANLEAYALTEGIKKSWNEMDQAEQTTLRYNYLMSVTSDAQGDFARTSDSFSNQLRILSGRFTEMKISLGEKFLPYANMAVGVALKLVEKFQGLPGPIQKVILVIGGLAALIGPAVALLGGLVVVAGAVATAIGTIGAPVLVVISVVGPLLGVLYTLQAVWIGVAIKTGLVKKAFESVNLILKIFSDIIKGDVDNANMKLQSGFGMSSKEAQKFIKKVLDAKARLIQLKNTVLDVKDLILLIFTGKTDKMMQQLVNKFGYSKKEAKKFADGIDKLKKLVKEYGEKAKDVAINAIGKFIDYTKRAAKFVVDHRKQIAKIIEFTIKLGVKTLEAGKLIYSILRKMKSEYDKTKLATQAVLLLIIKKLGQLKSKTKDVLEYLGTKILKVKGFFDNLKTSIGNVITKISGIKFPSPPSWIPGFAEGVLNFAGGMALVGEKGPELVRLPKGADVIPNNEIKQTISSFRSIEPTFPKPEKLNANNIIYLNMYNQISEKVDINTFFNKFMELLKSHGVSVRNGT